MGWFGLWCTGAAVVASGTAKRILRLCSSAFVDSSLFVVMMELVPEWECHFYSMSCRYINYYRRRLQGVSTSMWALPLVFWFHWSRFLPYTINYTWITLVGSHLDEPPSLLLGFVLHSSYSSSYTVLLFFCNSPDTKRSTSLEAFRFFYPLRVGWTRWFPFLQRQSWTTRVFSGSLIITQS